MTSDLNLMVIILGVLSSLTRSITANKGPIVKIEDGVLIVAFGKANNGRQYRQFLGIPYGTVKKRFKMSEPVMPWTGNKIVNDSGPGCTRIVRILNAVKGVEDCLTLDVYTPKHMNNNTNKNYPVMFWIHRLGFIEGSAVDLSGHYFMEHDVVLVIINYRLGPLGFLNALVKSARGNQGLKDMVLALKWVQKNIQHFSGDRNRVVIFGNNGGGSSASFLTLSPMAKGLFHGAIMQSGNALSPFVTKNNPGIKYAKQLAASVDCPSSDPEKLVKCLQTVKPEDLFEHCQYMNFIFDSHAIQFGPTLETTFEGESNDTIFMEEDPFSVVEKGDFNKVPIIIGHISHELYGIAASILSSPTDLKKLNCQFGRVWPNMLFLEESAEDPFKAIQQIKNFYFNNTTYLSMDNLDSFTAMINDRHFFHSTKVIAAEYAKYVPVYAYNYTHKDPKPSRKYPGHAAEIKFMFKPKGIMASFFPIIKKNDKNYNFSRSLISMWVSFARDGKPEKLWGSNSTKEWLPLEVDKPQRYLQINDKPFMTSVSEEFEASKNFWDSLTLKENGLTWTCSCSQT